MATYKVAGGTYDDRTGLTTPTGSGSSQTAPTASGSQASYSTSQRGTGAPTVNFTPGMYYGKMVNTPEEFLAQDNPATRSGGTNELGQKTNIPSAVSAPGAISTPQATPVAPPTPTTREEAIATLKQQGYQNPDDIEIAGVMSQSGTLSDAQGINNKYQQSLQAIRAQGTPVTDSAGQASAVIEKSLKSQQTQENAPSVMTIASQIDPSIEKNFPAYDDFNSPYSQRKSIVEEYYALSDKLGIDKINAELIDAKRIIEGTEDDIRSEVQKAGGFATESQVQALANSRNKSLIKNYNYLLDMKNNVTTQLSTLMDLTIQDRKMAQDEFDRKMNYSFKIAEFKRMAISDARETTNNLIKNIGYDGLLNSLGGDLTAQTNIEKLLGLSPGGLVQAALGSGGGGGGNISNTTQAIINNPSLFDDLTPTEKGKVITQLQENGYDTSNLGLKGLSDPAIQNISQTQKAIDDLNYLKFKIQGNEDQLGPIKGLAAINPWSDARKLQADVDRVRQTVGKALEGGVLRKEDEEKYKKILSTLTDTPETAYYKIDALVGSITRDIENYKSLQQSAGRSLDVGSKLQKTGSSTKVEDLRNKYNY